MATNEQVTEMITELEDLIEQTIASVIEDDAPRVEILVLQECTLMQQLYVHRSSVTDKTRIERIKKRIDVQQMLIERAMQAKMDLINIYRQMHQGHLLSGCM